MQLRVFKARDGTLAVEVSSPLLPATEYRWFVPLVLEADFSPALGRAGDMIRVQHAAATYFPIYMLIRSVLMTGDLWTEAGWTEAGVLSDKVSNNLLNQISDRLGWDLPPR